VAERQLLVFVCTTAACCTRAHAFSALRVQLRTDSQAPVTAEAVATSGERSACASGARGGQQDTGASSAAPHSTEGASSAQLAASCVPRAAAAPAPAAAQPQPAFAAPQAEAAGALDFTDLMGELDSMAAATQAAPKLEPSKPVRPAARVEPDAADALVGPSEAGHIVELPSQLPEFWIDAESEPAGPPPRAEPGGDAELEHIEQLLAEYTQEEEQRGQDSPASASAASTGGEAYERDNAYSKFQRRPGRRPEQCVRCGRLGR
jgi:hypothetical protein